MAESPTDLLREGARTGRRVDLSVVENCVVNADALREIIVGELSDRTRLDVKGAEISGVLDLEFVEIAGPLEFLDCNFRDGIVCEQVTIKWMTFTDCSINGGIHGYQLKVTNDLQFSRSKISGSVMLDRCHVGGDLYFGECELSGAPTGEFAISLMNGRCGSLDVDVSQIKGSLGLAYLRTDSSLAINAEIEARSDEVSIAGKGLDCGTDLITYEDSRFVGEVILDSTRVRGDVDLAGEFRRTGSTSGNPSTGVLSADSLRCDGTFVVASGFKSFGEVNLSDSSTQGSVLLLGRFEGGDGQAINAPRLQCAGDLVLLDTLATGQVNIENCVVEGRLDVLNGEFTSDRRIFSFTVAESRIGGSLNVKAKSMGSISAAHTMVGQDLDLRGLQLSDDSRDEPDSSASILAGDFSSIQIGGSVLSSEAVFRGHVQISGARVGQNVELEDVRLDEGIDLSRSQIGGIVLLSTATCASTNWPALNLNTTECYAVLVKDSILLNGIDLYAATVHRGLEVLEVSFENTSETALRGDSGRFERDLMLVEVRAATPIELRRAEVNGRMLIEDSQLAALLGNQTAIKGPLVLRNSHIGSVDLNGAEATGLHDDAFTWEGCNWVDVAGFEYGRILEDSPVDHEMRLAWLNKLYEFSRQPYQHLASVYRRMGDDGSARLILRTMWRRELSSESQPGLNKAIRWILQVLVGNGYSPLRVIPWALLAFLLGLVFVRIGVTQDVFVLVENPAVSADDPCATTDPCFHAPGYVADVLLPIVDLGEGRYWRVDDSHGAIWGYLYSAAIVAGWSLSAVFIAAFTPAVRKE